MTRVLAAVWDFVVGDDWRLAVGAVVAIGGAAVVVAAGLDAWWFAPGAIGAMLAGSVRHAGRRGGG